MQIQPTSAASAAAGNISQATSRDRVSGGAADAAHVSVTAGVEQVGRSEAASADRDAQGGGQGLEARAEQEPEPESGTAAAPSESGLSVSSPEPPSQLDIVG